MINGDRFLCQNVSQIYFVLVDDGTDSITCIMNDSNFISKRQFKKTGVDRIDYEDPVISKV